MTLHLTGPASRFFETSRSSQPAGQVNAVVRHRAEAGTLWDPNESWTFTVSPSQRGREQCSLEATVAYSADDALCAEDLGRIQVARAAAAEAQATEAVRILLRSRLRLAFLIVAATFGVMGILGTLNALLNPDTIYRSVWQALAFFVGPIVVCVALSTLLWNRPSLSLAQLRTAELALTAIFAVGCIWKQFSYLEVGRSLAQSFGGPSLTVLASYHGLLWFALLTVYGLFVPNTWHRCAAVMAFVAACPFAVVLVQAVRADWGITGRPFLYYLTILSFWVIFGATLAVFGSHHLEVLRREASEARQLGQYRLKKRLGAGGMGEVYLAEHRFLRRPCAVKLVRPERVGDPQNLRRFEQEVQATAALTHWNTVEIFDYGNTEDGAFYYVMEYLPGLSLAELVKRYGPLPPARAVYLLRQVCAALREAHATGLIHRDIKPGNIITSIRGGLYDVAKLVDFGLVQVHGIDPTGEAGIVGTPAYMSPEQAAGLGPLDARSDLYNLGAVAYFLLTAERPVVREKAPQVLAADRTEAVLFPARIKEGLPTDLQAVVLRCLAKDPADRFCDADSLDRALAACACAGSWTSEKAAQWWQEATRGQATMPNPTLQM